MWGAILAAGLHAQRSASASGITTEETREHTAVLEMGHEQRATKAESASVPWRSLSSEAGDDPTLGADVPEHDPPKAARKAAEKAEHLSKKGRHEDAITEFRAALAIDPQYYEAENNLALELEAVGKT
jgi:tetratricopeptide (TPR) repeat protein